LTSYTAIFTDGSVFYFRAAGFFAATRRVDHHIAQSGGKLVLKSLT